MVGHLDLNSVGYLDCYLAHCSVDYLDYYLAAYLAQSLVGHLGFYLVGYLAPYLVDYLDLN